MQGYLAACETVDELISDAELDWRTERQARFAAGNLLDAVAPTNFAWSNPAVLKETIDRGGANLLRGGRRLLRDMTRSPHLPASVDTSKFEVGVNLAVTPGSVVLRNEVLELIQYRPATEQVREVPLLLVPPTINKFYILDISPGRSLVEYLVGAEQQVFTISWRNPEAAQGHFDLDTYGRPTRHSSQRSGRGQLVRLLPRQFGVEHGVLRLLDRRVRELDREHRVVRSALGAPLGAIRVGLSPLGVDVVANLRDVLVPRALQVIPPDRELVLVRLSGFAQLLGSGLSIRSRGLGVRLKVGLGLVPRRYRAPLRLLGPSGKLGQLVRESRLLVRWTHVYLRLLLKTQR